MPPRKPRVLLVDDDADTCEMYSWSLEVRGFDTFAVGDAVSALAEAGTDPADAIVTDLTLPGLDGLAFAERLKAAPSTSAAPIILLSGHSLDGPTLERARGTCARILLKPVLPDDLADVITGALVDAISVRVGQQLRRIEHRVRGAGLNGADVLMDAVAQELAGVSQPTAALLADEQGKYVAVNDAASEFTGRSRAELLGTSVWELTPNVQIAQGRRMWADFIARGSMQGTYTLSGPDGQVLTMWFTAAANVVPGLHLSLLAVLPPGASYPAAA